MEGLHTGTGSRPAVEQFEPETVEWGEGSAVTAPPADDAPLAVSADTTPDMTAPIRRSARARRRQKRGRYLPVGERTRPAAIAAWARQINIWLAWDGPTAVTDIHGAAVVAGISPRTVYNWIDKGRVEVRYSPAGKVRVVLATLWRRERPAYAARPASGYREPTAGVGTSGVRARARAAAAASPTTATPPPVAAAQEASL
jgi:hypothetical protein